MERDVIARIRKEAQHNYDEGKKISRDNKWCRVNWFYSDGWNENIERELKKLGYRIIKFEDCLNLFIEWDGDKAP